MSDGTVLPVIAGLVAGIIFVAIVTILISPFTVISSNIKLEDEFGDLEGQQKAVDVLLTEPEIQTFVARKNINTWAESVLGIADATIEDVYDYYYTQLDQRVENKRDNVGTLLALERLVTKRF